MTPSIPARRLSLVAFACLLVNGLSVAALAVADYATPYHFTTLAGVSSIGSRDGTGAAAQFYGPAGIATDAAGNVFVADEGNHTIRKVTPVGVVSTFAGSPGIVGGADGLGAAARFQNPQGLAVDSSGNLFVADTGNHTIRKITPSGVVTTLAGRAGEAGDVDGEGSVARFNRPRGLAVDTAGRVYVTDAGNARIRRIETDGTVASLEGTFRFPESAEIYANVPVAYGAIAVDAAGNLCVSRFLFKGDYTHGAPVSDYYSYYVGYVTKITPAGVQSDLWETYVQAFYDGREAGTFVAGIAFDPAGQMVTSGFALAIDAAGNKYETDWALNIVRRTPSGGVATTWAGLATTAASGTADGTDVAARFRQPQKAVVDTAGSLFVTDSASHCLRKVTTGGVVTTFAGAPDIPGSADGAGGEARFNQPIGLAIDRTDNLYVADFANHTIRKISPSGQTTTLAGTAGAYGVADGQGAAARFWYPTGVAVDGAGNVYVTVASTIRKISPLGMVTTLAGAADAVGYVDGVGSVARFTAPYGVAVDTVGNLYVTEAPRSPPIARVRKISPTGEVSTIAGGDHGSTDGIGTAARFHESRDIAVDPNGNLFIADTFNQTIRRIAPDRTVTTLAGLSDSPGSADGTGSAARFYYPQGIAVDSAGTVYVTSGTTLRKGQLAVAPQIAEQPRSQTVAAGSAVTFTVGVSGRPPPTYQWYRGASLISGATGSSFSLSNVRSSDAGDYTVVVTNSVSSVTSTAARLTVGTGSTPPPNGGGGGGGAIGTGFVLALFASGLARLRRPVSADSVHRVDAWRRTAPSTCRSASGFARSRRWRKRRSELASSGRPCLPRGTQGVPLR